MKKKRIRLQTDEVVTVPLDVANDYFNRQAVFMMDDFSERLADRANNPTKLLFKREGLECSALRFGSKGWQTGKLRCVIEFEPDEEETETIDAETVEPPQIAAAGDSTGLDELRELTDTPET